MTLKLYFKEHFGYLQVSLCFIVVNVKAKIVIQVSFLGLQLVFFTVLFRKVRSHAFDSEATFLVIINRHGSSL